MARQLRIQRFPINTAGRDFAVGDIHGHFTLLQRALDAAGFKPEIDRLFSVGDLVDRGPESADALRWLDKPWFHAVQGNHEDMAIQYATIGIDPCTYMANGGRWFIDLYRDEQANFAVLFADLPIAIEVETPAGTVGLVHADCPRRSWQEMVSQLQAGGVEADHVAAMCQWSRNRIKHGDAGGVDGVRAVVVGHTPLHDPVVLGNVYHIDTGGWRPDDGGRFTLLDLHTLQVVA